MPVRNLVLFTLLATATILPILSCSSTGASQESQRQILKTVADVPLPGPAVRFDYQSLDPANGRLYIAHMNADQLVVFDTKKRKVVANLDGFRRVHGVIAVPELNRVFASVTGDHQVAIVDSTTLKILAHVGKINYPDGLAYAPGVNRVFVSDEHGGADVVIEVANYTQIATIPLGGGAGNTMYDSGSGKILVAVHGKNELVTIDPATAKIAVRTSLTGLDDPHGIALDVENRLAFVAGEGNSKLVVVDLRTMSVGPPLQVGRDPDVLAFDNATKRLYVSAESGEVTVFHETNQSLQPEGGFHLPHAHTVSVDPQTHLVYFPLENWNGKPVLRIMEFSGELPKH